MKIRDVIELNKVVKRVKNEKSQILLPTLDPKTIKLVLHTDAIFNNLPDDGGQGGHIIFSSTFTTYFAHWYGTPAKSKE